MKATKTLSVIGVGAAVVTGSMMAVNLASAQTATTERSERQQQHATELAERFNLDVNEVKDYLNEKHEQRQAERETKRAEHLASLVENGTLTQEQVDALTELKNSIKAEVKALRESDAEREDIRNVMKEGRAKVKTWAEAEGIDLEDIHPEKGNHRGFRNR